MKVIMRQCLQGLKYIHQCHRVHRDIKPANILVDLNGRVKVIDFGLCTIYEPGMSYSCGTPHYMAPEIIDPAPYKQNIDIWSLGICLYELIFRQKIYPEEENEMKVLECIVANGRPPYPHENMSPELKNFLDRCLEPNKNARPTAAQLLQHPFVACGGSVAQLQSSGLALKVRHYKLLNAIAEHIQQVVA